MNRREEIEAYIVDSRSELQYGPLNDRALGAATEQWYDRLRFIPDPYLGECYRLAMDNHGTRSPLLAKEIVDQWRIVSARPGFRDTRKDVQEKTCPNFCSAAGWYVVNAAGVMQKDFGSADYLYTKPCPIHRSQGYRADPNVEMGPRLVRPETIDEKSKGFSTGAPVEGWSSAAAVGQKVIPNTVQNHPLIDLSEEPPEEPELDWSNLNDREYENVNIITGEVEEF